MFRHFFNGLFVPCICFQLASCTSLAGATASDCGDIDFSKYDENRVASFFAKYSATTFKPSNVEKARILDARLQETTLTLADKIALLKRLAPKRSLTGPSEEARIERLILSVPPQELPFLKYSVDYDGDYKDMVEYIFHDVDDKNRQKALLAHLSESAPIRGVKVLTDVDDTMYANLVDKRYPKGTLYPGVLAFYTALAEEPFEHRRTPITTLSARPNLPGGVLEEGSIAGLIQKSSDALCPTALSGKAVSSLIGTAETVWRVNAPVLRGEKHHDKEDEIGKVKFANFAAYSQIYPDYNFVFIGDSGQGDSITAASMVTDATVSGTDRVLTTFIHDLDSGNDTGQRKRASPSFDSLDERLKVTITSDSPKGVIVFRNYIAAATIAFAHGDKLGNLITADELGKVVVAALSEFGNIDFEEAEGDRDRLLTEYRADAKAAIALLESRDAAVSTSVIEKIESALARQKS